MAPTHEGPCPGRIAELFHDAVEIMMLRRLGETPHFLGKVKRGKGNVIMIHGYMGQAAQIKREQGARGVHRATAARAGGA